MPANLPRLEIPVSPELRQRIESYRRDLSEALKRRVATGEVVIAILEDFLAKTRFESKK